MLGTIFSFLIGIIAGTLTGLTPGIHTNLIATSIISIPILLKLPTSYFLIFITATSITHTFLNFIPSIFLGAPDSDTCLGILPGHKFLLKGHGHHATKLTLTGSVIAIISLIIIIPIFFFIIPKIYPIIKQMMGFILIWISIFLLLNESNKTTSLFI